MAILIQDTKAAREVRYYSIDEARVKWKLLKQKAIRWFFVACFAFFISPIATLACLCMCFFAISQIWGLFFRNTYYMRQYMALFQPQTAEKVISIIGYRVYESEVDGHLAIIKSGNIQSLMDMQDKMERITTNRPRWVGLDDKTAKTHIALIGTTGAGKTECVRSTTDDLMKNGAGIFFNDGKADVKMILEVLAQAKENGRETSVRILNLIKAEKLSESNTFNFIANMHPMKLSGFLSNLAFKGDGGDGSHAHFQNRGKTLLAPTVYSLWLRKQLANEPFDLSTIQFTMQFLPFCIHFITFYCVCRDIDSIIKNNEDIMAMIEKDRSIIIGKTDYFDNIEKLKTKLIASPNEKQNVDRYFGFDSKIALDCYTQVFLPIKAYIGSVWNVAVNFLNCIAVEIYHEIKNDEKVKKVFFDKNLNEKNVISLSDIQACFNELKSNVISAINGTGDLAFIYSDAIYKKELEDGYAPNNKPGTVAKTIQEAFQPNNSLEKPSNDAIQQHAYAQQQWDALFSTLTPYAHIFSQPHSEIELTSLFRDNQILYVLLPPLELSKDQVSILGKILIASIKDYASSALGGEVLTAHKTISAIKKDRETPKPFTLIVLDEYGSYPVDDLDTILAQVRSINFSVMLGIQDIASLKAGGTNDTSKERALANTTKIFFKLKDKASIEWADAMISEEVVEDPTYKRDAVGDLVTNTEVNIKKEKIIAIRKIQEADNGFCVMFLGGQNDRAIWLQTFYRGGKTVPTMLKHFEPVNGLSNELYLKYAI